MPRFSIIVPSYGNAQYLTACLKSIEDQSFEDWETVVVDDASIDGSLDIALGFAKSDPRIRVVEMKENRGKHLARISGVEASLGEYLLFLDADDEFLPCLLERLDERLMDDPDAVVHFGIETAPTEGMSKWEADAFFESANESWGELSDSAIVEAVFSERFGFRRDWRITQRVFPSAVAKASFCKMARRRLECAEDGYEYFVLACNEKREITANDTKGYLYRIGRGSTNERKLDIDGFSMYALSLFDCKDAAGEYAAGDGDLAIIECASDFGDRLLETLMTDWHDRVIDAEKEASVRYVASLFGAEKVAEQLFRLVRDDAYALLDRGEHCKGNEPFLAWMMVAEELKSDSGGKGSILRYEEAARSHIADLRKRSQIGLWGGGKAAIRSIVGKISRKLGN